MGKEKIRKKIPEVDNIVSIAANRRRGTRSDTEPRAQDNGKQRRSLDNPVNSFNLRALSLADTRHRWE